MGKFFIAMGIFLIGTLILMPFGFTQELLAPIMPDVSNVDFLEFFLKSIGGAQGASALAIVALVVQVLMKFVATPWANRLLVGKGETKLAIVLLLTYIGGLTALIISGLTFGAAFLHSTSLSALLVLLNEIYSRFIAKK